MAGRIVLFTFLAAFIWFNTQNTFVSCALTPKLLRKIAKINHEGPYLGLIIPNDFELNPLLKNPGYTPSDNIIDFAGKCMHQFPFKKRPKSYIYNLRT
jgi:hypothetical protein